MSNFLADPLLYLSALGLLAGVVLFFVLVVKWRVVLWELDLEEERAVHQAEQEDLEKKVHSYEEKLDRLEKRLAELEGREPPPPT